MNKLEKKIIVGTISLVVTTFALYVLFISLVVSEVNKAGGLGQVIHDTSVSIGKEVKSISKEINEESK